MTTSFLPHPPTRPSVHVLSLFNVWILFHLTFKNTFWLGSKVEKSTCWTYTCSFSTEPTDYFKKSLPGFKAFFHSLARCSCTQTTELTRPPAHIFLQTHTFFFSFKGVNYGPSKEAHHKEDILYSCRRAACLKLFSEMSRGGDLRRRICSHLPNQH